MVLFLKAGLQRNRFLVVQLGWFNVVPKGAMTTMGTLGVLTALQQLLLILVVMGICVDGEVSVCMDDLGASLGSWNHVSFWLRCFFYRIFSSTLKKLGSCCFLVSMGMCGWIVCSETELLGLDVVEVLWVSFLCRSRSVSWTVQEMVLRLVSGVGPGGTSTKDALIGIFMSINHRFVVVGRYRDIGTQLDGPPWVGFGRLDWIVWNYTSYGRNRLLESWQVSKIDRNK